MCHVILSDIRAESRGLRHARSFSFPGRFKFSVIYSYSLCKYKLEWNIEREKYERCTVCCIVKINHKGNSVGSVAGILLFWIT